MEANTPTESTGIRETQILLSSLAYHVRNHTVLHNRCYIELVTRALAETYQFTVIDL